MLVLTVERNWQSSYNMLTILRDSKGAVKKIISSSIQQIKKGTKEYNLNGKVYQLNWDNVKPRNYAKL